MILPYPAIEILERSAKLIAESSTEDRARNFIVDEVTKALYGRLEQIMRQLTDESEMLVKDLLRRNDFSVPEEIYLRPVVDLVPPIDPAPEIHFDPSANVRHKPTKN